MTDLQKLISLRESISSRIELSSEEHDRIFLKISLDLLEGGFIDESIETLDYMTSGGRDEGLRNIIDGFIIKHEYGYAINAITKLKSTQEKDEFYMMIIKKKIVSGERDKLIMIESLISNPKIKAEAIDYITDPEKILQEYSNSKKSSELTITEIEQEKKLNLLDATRKAKHCEMSEVILILKRIYGRESDSFAESALNCFSIAIKNAKNQRDIDNIKSSYKSTQLSRNKPWNNTLHFLRKKEDEIRNHSLLKQKIAELENVLRVFLTRRVGSDFLGQLKEDEIGKYYFLVELTLECPIIEVDKKRTRYPIFAIYEKKGMYTLRIGQKMNTMCIYNLKRTLASLKNILGGNLLNDIKKYRCPLVSEHLPNCISRFILCEGV